MFDLNNDLDLVDHDGSEPVNPKRHIWEAPRQRLNWTDQSVRDSHWPGSGLILDIKTDNYQTSLKNIIIILMEFVGL